MERTHTNSGSKLIDKKFKLIKPTRVRESAFIILVIFVIFFTGMSPKLTWTGIVWTRSSISKTKLVDHSEYVTLERKKFGGLVCCDCYVMCPSRHLLV